MRKMTLLQQRRSVSGAAPPGAARAHRRIPATAPRFPPGIDFISERCLFSAALPAPRKPVAEGGGEGRGRRFSPLPSAGAGRAAGGVPGAGRPSAGLASPRGPASIWERGKATPAKPQAGFFPEPAGRESSAFAAAFPPTPPGFHCTADNQKKNPKLKNSDFSEFSARARRNQGRFAVVGLPARQPVVGPAAPIHFTRGRLSRQRG